MAGEKQFEEAMNLKMKLAPPAAFPKQAKVVESSARLLHYSKLDRRCRSQWVEVCQKAGWRWTAPWR